MLKKEGSIASGVRTDHPTSILRRRPAVLAVGGVLAGLHLQMGGSRPAACLVAFLGSSGAAGSSRHRPVPVEDY